MGANIEYGRYKDLDFSGATHNFTPAQLTQVNQLAKYLAYSSVICLVVTIMMLNYIIKSI